MPDRATIRQHAAMQPLARHTCANLTAFSGSRESECRARRSGRLPGEKDRGSACLPRRISDTSKANIRGSRRICVRAPGMDWDAYLSPRGSSVRPPSSLAPPALTGRAALVRAIARRLERLPHDARHHHALASPKGLRDGIFAFYSKELHGAERPRSLAGRSDVTNDALGEEVGQDLRGALFPPRDEARGRDDDDQYRRRFRAPDRCALLDGAATKAAAKRSSRP